MPIRVLLVDDHSALRRAVREVLAAEADIQVVAEAGDGGAAVRRAGELTPDVAVTDLRLPDMSGVEVVGGITRDSPATRVLVMSAYSDSYTAGSAARAGAAGFVPKDALFEELAGAVRAAAAGQVYQSPSLGRAGAGH